MNWYNNKIYKLTHWEYWSTWAIYLPLAPIWLFYSLKNKDWLFFERVNPGIKFGGMAMQSKIEMYDKLPNHFIPKTTFITKNSEFNEITHHLKNYSFPIIVKPNEGLKGLGVEVINNQCALQKYHQNTSYDYLIQEKIAFLNEIGVFYCRYPNQLDGFITGITDKRHLKIIGDGVSTVETLMLKNRRAQMQLSYFKKHKPDLLIKIPEQNEEMVLLEIGSHTRGAAFIEVTNQFYEQIYNIINPIAKNIEGFYYGRFDILYQCNKNTSNISDFKIIELNGTMSEPIHIYSPHKSILNAWKEITKHWGIMSKIAGLNGKTQNSTHISTGIKIIFESLKLEKRLKKQLYQF